ncbi:MAG: archaeosortase/exosortase family protein [Opitutaceae bacterium]|nr:archaeosortase/exosortase family protein [Opitutaceae bacterium]
MPVLLVAFWPVWRWYLARMADGSDEPLGLIALLTAAAFLPRRGWRGPIGTRALIGAIAALAFHLVGFEHLPALVRAALAVGAIVCVLPRDPARSPLPLIALLLLSLPLIATLQFYLGYPLRAVTTWCAAHLLALGGQAVAAHGTVLQWAGEEVLVDAPCSGIRMLWTSCYLSATLAAVHRLPARRFLRLARWTAAVVFLANLARTILLFFLETGQWPNPPWAHEAAGLAMFLLAAVACVAAAHHLRRPTVASLP